MWNLSFFQRVRLALVIIVTLLLVSGFAPLWNLASVYQSTSRVNERALPMLTATNRTQIQLLQQVKGSSLAYLTNAHAQTVYQLDKFREATRVYQATFKQLQQHSNSDASTQTLAAEIQSQYSTYVNATELMFSQKLDVQQTQQQIKDEKQQIVDLIDTVGAGLVELTFYQAPVKFTQQMKVVAGFASGADSRLLALFATLDEILTSNDENKLLNLHNDFNFVISDSRHYYQTAIPLFEEFGDPTLITNIDSAFDALTQRLTRANNILHTQILLLKQVQQARLSFERAGNAANAANTALDELRLLADEQFTLIQSGVSNSVKFGVLSAIIVTIILIFLAVQLFKSMRQAIQSKVDDLSELNQLGKLYAISRSSEFAFQITLHSLRAKWNADCAQVHILNKLEEFVLCEAVLKEPEQSHLSAERWQSDTLISELKENRQVIIKQQPDPNTQTVVILPLEEDDKLTGFIEIVSWHSSIHFSDSDNEYVASIISSLMVTLHAIKMREVIEEQNRNLEQKIQERTTALHQKNNDIANMMANLHQGLFTITEGGMIHPEYAAFLETIFETNNIAGRYFTDLLFDQTRIRHDQLAQNIAAVDVMIGQDVMMFECNQHCLITELIIYFSKKRSKRLELDWEPIVLNGVIEKLMVTVRDVTDLKALEAEAREQKAELQMISEVLALAPQKFVTYQDNTRQELLCCRELICGNESFQVSVVEEIYRKLHTIKGNARTYNFSQITDIVHDTEEIYSRIINGETELWQPQLLLNQLGKVDVVVRQYDTLFYEKLHGDIMMQKGIGLDVAQVNTLLDEIRTLTRTNKGQLPKPVQHIVSKTYNMLIRLDAKPLEQILDDVLISIRSLAKQLNKDSPAVNIDGGKVLFHRELHNVLSSVFMHLLRNALDHGIEDAKERKKKGKPLRGNTDISLILKSDHVDIVLSDDGRGINLDKLYLQGVDNGLCRSEQRGIQPENIANLIFDAGVSTAEVVNSVSGRGVGMSAVKSCLEQHGASISILLADIKDVTKETNTNIEARMGCRPFTTHIKIPQKFYSLPLDPMTS